ncbi:MAG: aminotransferase class V-fold PLP-dependent enzyme [Micromonosporaceae bacterium]
MVREEGGTPAIVESIRAGLVFALKDAIGTDVIEAVDERVCRSALRRWAANPHLEVLGSPTAPRLPIISFRVRHGQRYLHHHYVVTLLNDLFGIQARGGCSCAGPYGHDLLGIDARRSRAIQEQVSRGRLGAKPGWARVTFNYLMSAACVDYVIEAVDLIGWYGHRLLDDYRFDPASGHWRHRSGWPQPALRLADLTPALRPGAPRPWVGEEALPGYLASARALLAGRPDQIEQGPTGLPADFEALREFHLPPACLSAVASSARW